MVIKTSYYLLTLIAQFMRLKVYENDVYENFYVDKEIFDLQKIQKIQNGATNKEVIGKMKDERKVFYLYSLWDSTQRYIGF